MISKYILLAILLSALVTWIPRVLPFILVKYKGLPPMVERFLKYHAGRVQPVLARRAVLAVIVVFPVLHEQADPIALFANRLIFPFGLSSYLFFSFLLVVGNFRDNKVRGYNQRNNITIS